VCSLQVTQLLLQGEPSRATLAVCP
jgi:hypothetical protein